MRTGDPGLLRWLIPGCWFWLGLGGAVWADVFDGFRDAPAPEVLREVADPAGDLEAGAEVRVRRLVFRSVPAPGWTNEIYAVVARPAKEGEYPGVMLFHGGTGGAMELQAVEWARSGYVAVTLDLPGIADPVRAIRSAGGWRYRPYGIGHWRPFPTGEPVVIQQAVVGAMQAFALLRDQPDVDVGRIGVMGWSWGGYMTTMICGLLGDRVAAGFSYFGAGFYEWSSFNRQLGSLPVELRESWLETLDAGRRAVGITAPFLVAAPANDQFFYPPSVERTLAAVPGTAVRVYSPNTHHWMAVPGGTRWSGDEQLAMRWLDWHLRGQGDAFPAVTWEESPDPDSVRFRVSGPRPFLAVTLWISQPLYPEHWPDRIWRQVPARKLTEGRYEAVLPRHLRPVGAAWFASASDDRPLTVSTPMQVAGDGIGAGLFYREDFEGVPEGERGPGWTGNLRTMRELDVVGGNRVIGAGPGLLAGEGRFEFPIWQASSTGIQMGVRFRVGEGAGEWMTEWLVSGAGLGRGFRISGGGVGFVGLDEAGQVEGVGESAGFGESVGIRRDGWNEVEFVWGGDGAMELWLNGGMAARREVVGLPSGFGMLRMTDRVGEGGGRLVYDEIRVGSWTGPSRPRGMLNLRWLGSPALEGGRWRILHGFEGVPGQVYGMETSRTLGGAGWEELGEFRAGETGAFVVAVEVGDPEGEGERYFRVRRLED